MSTKPLVQRFVSELAEKPLKATAEEVKRQAVGAKDDLYAQLVGKTNKTDSEIEQMRSNDQQDKSQNIDYITRELKMMSGDKSPSKKHNNADRRRADKKLKMEHHNDQVREVVSNSQQGPTGQQSERQRLADQQTELVNKTITKKQQLSESIDMPVGRQTGMPGRRQHSPTRMKPPKTSENKAGSSRE